MGTVIDGDVEITYTEDSNRINGPDTGRVCDRVRLLDNGYCHAVIDRGYQQEFHPPREIVEIVKHESNGAPIPDEEHRIDHGAEIHFKDGNEPMPSDEVALLPGGWTAARLHGGGVAYTPQHRIEGIYAHTTDEQEDAGWFR